MLPRIDEARAVLTLGVALLLSLGSSRAQEQPKTLIHDGQEPALFLMFTGDVIGYLDTCGCKKNPAGGLARRSWVLDQLQSKFPAAPVVLLDSGNFSDNPTPQGDVKTVALLEGMATLGYSAINVGERDVKMGYDYFRKRTMNSEIPFLSANIVRHDTEEPIFGPHVIVDAIAPEGDKTVKVGIIGVARFNPIFLKSGPDGSNMKILHPIEPVRRSVEELNKAGVEMIVLLAALHKDDARRIVREVPGVDFVVGSYGGLYTSQVEKEGDTFLLYSGNQGKRLGETRVYFGAEHSIEEQYTVMHFLTHVYPRDEVMQKFVIDAPQRRAGSEQSSLGRGSPYVGSVTCKECHDSQFSHWNSTAHAHALDTLQAQNASDRSECSSCHVTGAGQEGGFLDAKTTPHLAQVGCESCHGPARRHLANNRARYGKISIDSCMACHDSTNSPDFDYYAYLPRVRHGGLASR